MKKLFLLLFILTIGGLSYTFAKSHDKTPLKNQAVLMDIDGPIGPAIKDFIHRGINQARENNANIIVIRIDTPGGLDNSMRDIIKDILASPIPVASFVAPSGARAASAGTFILYASQVAAMAPGTNLGAATPVSIGGSNGTPTPQKSDQKPDEKSKKKKNNSNNSAMRKKVTNDAIAYIRSLAEMHGRNQDWAEKAVREAASIPASQALKLGVIDLIATNVSDLLNKINGREVTVLHKKQTLKTTGLVINHIQPDWRTKFLTVITNPNVAYFLIMLGIYGLIFEFMNPGFILPGVVGAICLLLALYALQLLPISYAALGLILLGIAFMIAEIFVPSFGALGIGGVIAFVAGSVMLMDVDVPGYQIAWELIVAMTIITAAFFILVIGMAIRARKRHVVSGHEELIDKIAIVKSDFENEQGWVQIHGETWKAESKQALKQGQKVNVVKVEGLTLHVKSNTD